MLSLNSHGQKMYYVNDTSQIQIFNDESKIKNERIFEYPNSERKNNKPYYLVNNEEVYTIALYNKEEFKKIIVYQPKQALKKFGSKAKHGAIVAFLREDLKEPTIEIISNKIYYKCTINGEIKDTTKDYFNIQKGKNCTELDLRDTIQRHLLYINFDNIIRVKNLGAGWDRTSIMISGGSFSGHGSNRIIRVSKEGLVKLIINTSTLYGKNKQTEIICNVIKLPK